MRYQNTYVTLDTRLYHEQQPTPLDNPRAGHLNTAVAKQLGWLDDDELMARWVEILGGQYVQLSFDRCPWPMLVTSSDSGPDNWAMGAVYSWRKCSIIMINYKIYI